jgi:hypothetical protein
MPLMHNLSSDNTLPLHGFHLSFRHNLLCCKRVGWYITLLIGCSDRDLNPDAARGYTTLSTIRSPCKPRAFNQSQDISSTYM